jgi:hypothetical protein
LAGFGITSTFIALLALLSTQVFETFSGTGPEPGVICNNSGWSPSIGALVFVFTAFCFEVPLNNPEFGFSWAVKSFSFCRILSAHAMVLRASPLWCLP